MKVWYCLRVLWSLLGLQVSSTVWVGRHRTFFFFFFFFFFNYYYYYYYYYYFPLTFTACWKKFVGVLTLESFPFFSHACSQDLELLEQVWGSYQKWQSLWETWKVGGFTELDTDSMELQAQQILKKVNKLGRELKGRVSWSPPNHHLAANACCGIIDVLTKKSSLSLLIPWSFFFFVSYFCLFYICSRWLFCVYGRKSLEFFVLYMVHAVHAHHVIVHWSFLFIAFSLTLCSGQELGDLRSHQARNRAVQEDHASDPGVEEPGHATSSLDTTQERSAEAVRWDM